MRVRIGPRLSTIVAGVFWGRVPWLYSTLHHPVEVPVQVAAYRAAAHKYIRSRDRVLDVGFGLGYGLRIMATKSGELVGIEIDRGAVSKAQSLTRVVPSVREVRHYDGYNIPYDANVFDVVACVDVIEHVPDYMRLIAEMIRVSRRVVLLSTPNRRPENTRPDGRPKNRWHIREWSYEELDSILQRMPGVRVDWNFLNGPWEGPFECTSVVCENTLALTPALMLLSPVCQQCDDLRGG